MISTFLGLALVTAFGAVGDGKTVCTPQLQAAIDQTAAAGGGTVVVPPGRYVAGTVFLRSHIRLQLEPGAMLVASTALSDYHAVGKGSVGDRSPYHFLVAQGVEDVTIAGGVIDGQGPAFWYPREKPGTWAKAREPRVCPLLEITDAHDVHVENLTIQNSPGWTLHMRNSERVWVRDVRINNDPFGPNTDGIDINGCHDVVVTGCQITVGDDAIVLKSDRDTRSCERIVVSDCILETNCIALQLGTESYFDMRDITFSNCVVNRSHRAIGIAPQDGATFERIVFSHITGNTLCETTVQRPIHIDLRRRTDQTPMPVLRDVLIDGCTFATTGRVLMTAENGGTLHNVTLRDLTLTYPSVEDPTVTAKHPRSNQFSNKSPEAQVARAALVMENMDGLRIEGLRVNLPPGRPAFPFAERWEKNVSYAERK